MCLRDPLPPDCRVGSEQNPGFVHNRVQSEAQLANNHSFTDQSAREWGVRLSNRSYKYAVFCSKGGSLLRCLRNSCARPRVVTYGLAVRVAAHVRQEYHGQTLNLILQEAISNLVAPTPLWTALEGTHLAVPTQYISIVRVRSPRSIGLSRQSPLYVPGFQ